MRASLQHPGDSADEVLIQDVDASLPQTLCVAKGMFCWVFLRCSTKKCVISGKNKTKQKSAFLARKQIVSMLLQIIATTKMVGDHLVFLLILHSKTNLCCFAEDFMLLLLKVTRRSVKCMLLICRVLPFPSTMIWISL